MVKVKYSIYNRGLCFQLDVIEISIAFRLFITDMGRAMQALSEIFPDLLNLEREALAHQFEKFNIQADGKDHGYVIFPSREQLSRLKHELQRYFKMLSIYNNFKIISISCMFYCYPRGWLFIVK
jgi:hypothetical protein